MKLTTYLVGPIQDCKDGGVQWRKEITPKLTELKVKVIDPTIEEAKEFGSMQKAQDMMGGWIAAGHREKFKSTMWNIINRDMDAVYASDFIVAVIDNERVMGGTLCEVWESVWRRRIPIYVVCKGPLKGWNMWMLGTCVKGEDWGGKSFDNFTQLMDYITDKYGKSGSKAKFTLRCWIYYNRYWGFFNIVLRKFELLCNKIIKKIFHAPNQLAEKIEAITEVVKEEEKKKEENAKKN